MRAYIYIYVYMHIYVVYIYAPQYDLISIINNYVYFFHFAHLNIFIEQNVQ